MIASNHIVTLNTPSSRARAAPFIIGAERGLREVMEAVRAVAPTDAAVLISGETGTGKELIARLVHEQSSRKGRACVTVNCAAIPVGLLESALFGHERGAFTGAIMQTLGCFQLADRGTLFLDEIGDLPLELQPKLLRVLQEREFERLGSHRTIKVDVRIVAATNCNLSEMVRERRFRADLFYRLNVFPISLPPLRHRREDIPELAWHFMSTLSARMNKRITSISDEAIERLQLYQWPGNIRELQNLIERAVVMSSGPVLHLSLEELQVDPGIRFAATANTLASTLAQVERDRISEVLDQVGWVVAGRNGAAVRLGLPRSTLMSRMNRLGLRRPQSQMGIAEEAAHRTCHAGSV